MTFLTLYLLLCLFGLDISCLMLRPLYLWTALRG